jgi:hypothetical protein
MPDQESPTPQGPAYTVEEPPDAVSERSASVDDGEGSVGSMEDLAMYMRALIAHRYARAHDHERSARPRRDEMHSAVIQLTLCLIRIGGGTLHP